MLMVQWVVIFGEDCRYVRKEVSLPDGYGGFSCVLHHLGQCAGESDNYYKKAVDGL